MDTNDLSRETNNAIILTAERFHDELPLQFGVLADICKTDDEFLDQVELLINEWLTEWDLDEVMMDVFFDNPPDVKEFKEILVKILSSIESVRKIPANQRKFDY